jgi:hypothetical protein
MHIYANITPFCVCHSEARTHEHEGPLEAGPLHFAERHGSTEKLNNRTVAPYLLRFLK